MVERSREGLRDLDHLAWENRSLSIGFAGIDQVQAKRCFERRSAVVAAAEIRAGET